MAAKVRAAIPAESQVPLNCFMTTDCFGMYRRILELLATLDQNKDGNLGFGFVVYVICTVLLTPWSRVLLEKS